MLAYFIPISFHIGLPFEFSSNTDTCPIGCVVLVDDRERSTIAKQSGFPCVQAIAVRPSGVTEMYWCSIDASSMASTAASSVLPLNPTGHGMLDANSLCA